jgi:hypothetical protein
LNLRFNFQHDIQNEGTKSIIREAYLRHIPRLDEMVVGDFAMDGAKPKKETAFLALLGSDNARPIEYMLKDHFNDAGKKKIHRILVLPFQESAGDHLEVGTTWTLLSGKMVEKVLEAWY